MAELHIIGELLGAKTSDDIATGLFCKWYVESGNSWKRVSGFKEGQTQVDTPCSPDEGSKWAHPIDLHFATKGLQGWPKIVLEVCRQDQYGRSDLAGYGTCYIPTSPGFHNLEVPLWRPVGSTRHEVLRYFLGGSPELIESDLVSNPTERFRLKTASSGTAFLALNIILRNFQKFRVQL